MHPLKSTVRMAVTCAALLTAIPAFAGPQPPAGWTDGYVMANGIRLHYWRTGGAKPPLIMAHGSSDDGLCWTNLAKEFTDRYELAIPASHPDIGELRDLWTGPRPI